MYTTKYKYIVANDLDQVDMTLNLSKKKKKEKKIFVSQNFFRSLLVIFEIFSRHS